jgi:anti-sigma regulatory factor (Ser/Thr protein kinase)
MARIDIHSLCLWITAAAVQHPNDLARQVVERTGLTRATVNKALARLVALNWLERSGTPRKPVHRPGLLRQVVQQYTLSGLQEDVPWSRDFAPFFQLPPHVRQMTQHAFVELLNNAIDHSEGASVTVSLRQTPSHVQLLVSDDGRGLFDKIEAAFDIDDPHLAIFELSKGKLTSEAKRHTGRGLFFTSKLADVFDLHANEVAFQQRGWETSGWRPARALKRRGTSVYAAIALDTPRSLETVLNAWSLDGAGVGFDRTVVPVRLMTSPEVGLESRAQARRVASRLGEFQRAEIDFDGIDRIGHGFADELFRVQAADHPRLDLQPVNMTAAVAAMVRSVRA